MVSLRHDSSTSASGEHTEPAKMLQYPRRIINFTPASKKASSMTHPDSPVCEGLEDHQQEEGDNVHRAEQPELEHGVIHYAPDYTESCPLREKSGGEVISRKQKGALGVVTTGLHNGFGTRPRRARNRVRNEV